MDDKDKTILINDDHMNFTRISPTRSTPEEIIQETANQEDNIFDLSDSLMGSTILPAFQESPEGKKLILTDRARFESKRVIGKGGGGEVELVLDRDIYRLVAIKRLKREFHNPAMLMRFVDEIRTVGHLEHPNIVPIHDVGKDKNGLYYFVMKYVYGETIQEIIQKLKNGDREYHKKYSIQYRTGIFREILKAIDFAHDYGIIHRDIKPANIMVGPHGEVMVMDWGIAKRLKKRDTAQDESPVLKEFEEEVRTMQNNLTETEKMYMTEAGTTIGTPAYMAPEQTGKEEQDERTDIYSLSTLFYEFLTLKPYLTPKKSLDELLRAIIDEKPRFAMMVSNRYQPAVPADLSHMLSKGLEKTPAKRYQSVKEMQKLLHQIEEGHTPVQCPFTMTKRSYQILINIVTNHPMLGVLFFMILLTLAGFGILFILSYFFNFL